MFDKDRLVDKPHWTTEYEGLDAYCEKVEGEKPLVVKPGELENKYKDKKLLSKVVEYVIRRTSEQEDEIADVMVAIEKLRIRIKKVALNVKLLLKTLPKDRVWKGPKIVEAIPQKEWGGKHPKPMIQYTDRLTPPIKKVHVTFGTDTDKCSKTEDCKRILQGLQCQHMSRGLKDIAYNFLVGDDGQIYEGRGWHQKPELSSKDSQYQDGTADIAFIGPYDEQTYPYALSYYLQDFLQFAMYKNILPDDVQVIMK